MTPASQRIFKFGLGLSAAMAIASLGAGVWAIVGAPFNAIAGLPLGNKQLVAYHFSAADFRIATVPEQEIFLSPDSQNLPALTASYQKWGGKNHWLKIPGVEINLWLLFTFSGVLPAVALGRRVRRMRRKLSGFPIVIVRQPT